MIRKRLAAFAATVMLAAAPLASALASRPFELWNRPEATYIAGPATGSGATVGEAGSYLQRIGKANIAITNKNGESLLENEPLVTGCRLTASDGSTILTVVRGDVIGSGKLSLTQLVALCDFYRSNAPVNTAYTLAADLNRNDVIDLSDLVQLATGFKNGYLDDFNVDPDEAQNAYLASMRKITLDGTNAVRAAENQPPLTAHPLLNQVAQMRAREMVSMHEMSHTRPDGSSCFSAWEANAWKAENVIYMYNDRSTDDLAAQAVDVWDKSPGHHANMVHERMKYIGIGYAMDEDGIWYGCQVFMSEGDIKRIDTQKTPDAA